MKTGGIRSSVIMSLVVLGFLVLVLSSCSRRTGCPGAITSVEAKVSNPS